MIKKIITHSRPHADELVALMFLRQFKEGEENFPGVQKSSVSFLTTGSLPDGKTANDFPDTLFLGCGGGIFDEHATSKKERQEGEICATLVAKKLGIDTDPALQRLLHFSILEDLEGSKVKDAVSVMIKYLHSCYKDKPEEVSEWADAAYWAEYMEDKKILEGKSFEEYKQNWQPMTYSSAYKALLNQGYEKIDWWKSFMDNAIKYQDDQYKSAVETFDKNAKVERIKTKRGGDLIFAVVVSDNEEMNKAARSRRADVIIIFNTAGNVGIFTSHKKAIDLTYVFVLLRMAEQHYRGEIKIKDQKELSVEGMIPGIPWYLIHARNAGYNGSLTTKDVEPTKIPHDKLVLLVKEGLK